MVLTLKDLTKKAKKKGIVVEQESSSSSLLKSWQQESTLFSIEKDQHSLQHPIENLIRKHIPENVNPNAPDLTLKQLKILYWICLNRPFKMKGENGISTILTIPYGTVRTSIEAIDRKDYIGKKHGDLMIIFVGKVFVKSTEKNVLKYSVIYQENCLLE